ncbi:MAG TPA: nickel pincer cofactor biosynthesis protein LarC [Terriglobia bacterium]|nr:nickel pincer cofactor biosynthesis protein LarC [Terriglobia bacterium]
MRSAYLDCSSGVSGDMFLAACLDAGLDRERLQSELASLEVGPCEFKVEQVTRGGLAGTHVEISAPGKQPHRHLASIEKLIESSRVGAGVKERSRAIFRRLGEAEARLHSQPVEKVHFHEVGAVDAILDIVGACVALELLGIGDLMASPLNLGYGRVSAAHGSLPVPAPATVELLRGIPVYSSGVEAELVTPTGAAIVSTLATGFGPLPPMKIESIGYGAGSRELQGHPNLLRLMIGDRVANPESQTSNPGAEVVAVIETSVDDMSPELYGYLVERALAAGALDISCAAIGMKKNRPGLEIRLLARLEQAEALADLVFAETTTLGLRISTAERRVLEREVINVETPYGPIRVKVGRRNGQVVNAAPEFEDCRRAALERGVPLKNVMEAALAGFRNSNPGARKLESRPKLAK